MAVTVIGLSPLYVYLQNLSGSNTIALAPSVYRYPFPIPGGVQARYLNKCVDGVSSQWVLWETLYQDINGAEYPGSSFDSATYKVQSIVYDREQG